MGTYWNGNGTHQAVYNELLAVVPKEGMADNTAIEAVRVLCNVYYDCYNNGGGNLPYARAGELALFGGFLLETDFSDAKPLIEALNNVDESDLAANVFEMLEKAADHIILWASN